MMGIFKDLRAKPPGTEVLKELNGDKRHHQGNCQFYNHAEIFDIDEKCPRDSTPRIHDIANTVKRRWKNGPA